jgi:hypothetical protein
MLNHDGVPNASSSLLYPSISGCPSSGIGLIYQRRHPKVCGHLTLTCGRAEAHISISSNARQSFSLLPVSRLLSLPIRLCERRQSRPSIPSISTCSHSQTDARTRITGHRSLAEIYAKEVLSAVEARAVRAVSNRHITKGKGSVRVLVSYSMAIKLPNIM